MHITSLLFNAAGVTFNNDDGSSRQHYISKLEDGERLFLIPFEYEGSTAYHIVNYKNHCIGNVPSAYVSDIYDHLSVGHKLECIVFERLGYDENGHRIDGYNLGVEVGIDIYDERPEPVPNPATPVATSGHTNRPVNKKSGRFMIGFGIFFVICSVIAVNPMTFVIGVLLLYFGIKRNKASKIIE